VANRAEPAGPARARPEKARPGLWPRGPVPCPCQAPGRAWAAIPARGTSTGPARLRHQHGPPLASLLSPPPRRRRAAPPPAAAAAPLPPPAGSAAPLPSSRPRARTSPPAYSDLAYVRELGPRPRTPPSPPPQPRLRAAALLGLLALATAAATRAGAQPACDLGGGVPCLCRVASPASRSSSSPTSPPPPRAAVAPARRLRGCTGLPRCASPWPPPLRPVVLTCPEARPGTPVPSEGRARAGMSARRHYAARHGGAVVLRRAVPPRARAGRARVVPVPCGPVGHL